MTFGDQTVTFTTSVGAGTYDADGIETTTDTVVVVPGCRHRPLRADETPQWLTNLATQLWKTTAGKEAAAVTSADRLTVDGVTYQVVGGAMPFTDLSGEVVKVTVLSKIETP